jgi:putative flippase GtrA
MFEWRSAEEWKRLWRYYQTGLVNTLFGYAAFALLVALGLNMYVAQITAHVAGVSFNYVTYSRYAFRDRLPSKSAFIASYAGNYMMSLFFLWAAARFIASAYASGAIAILCTSLINYFVLKSLVFRRKRGADGVS